MKLSAAIYGKKQTPIVIQNVAAKRACDLEIEERGSGCRVGEGKNHSMEVGGGLRG